MFHVTQGNGTRREILNSRMRQPTAGGGGGGEREREREREVLLTIKKWLKVGKHNALSERELYYEQSITGGLGRRDPE